MKWGKIVLRRLMSLKRKAPEENLRGQATGLRDAVGEGQGLNRVA